MGAMFWTLVIPLTLVALIVGYVLYADKKKNDKSEKNQNINKKDADKKPKTKNSLGHGAEQ